MDISVDNTYGCQCTYQSEYIETQLARDLTDLFVGLDNSKDLSIDRNTDNPLARGKFKDYVSTNSIN